ncbi:PREDICTED: vesicle-trafficking protein SEC22b-like [Amphimedon queenslandica]|nr:PREDICTED: vesicle-trafficking protein SEC22b-like [Amphimedon queenslandica]|eukprot:XP_003385017.2 PREDICTED: vesicle-trafficking protein SEC22b-like [Amphimedon queenslandica]
MHDVASFLTLPSLNYYRNKVTMALFTLLARASDGLPLSASIQDDDHSVDLSEYQTRAKKIFRRLSPQSPPRCSINSEPLVFHYIIEGGVCYLVLCESSYPPTLAFGYLEEVCQAFSDQHGLEISKATRPYHFIEFGTEIEKIKRTFSESNSRKTNQLRGLSHNLQEVQHIMFDNIDAVIQRGELIQNLSDQANKLVDGSKRFRKEARRLNLSTSMAAKLAIVAAIFIFIIFVRFWFF